MTVLENISKAHLEKIKIWDASILLLDSNIGLETLTYVLEKSYLKVKHIIYVPNTQE